MTLSRQLRSRNTGALALMPSNDQVLSNDCIIIGSNDPELAAALEASRAEAVRAEREASADRKVHH